MIEFNPVWKGHYNMLTQIKSGLARHFLSPDVSLL